MLFWFYCYIFVPLIYVGFMRIKIYTCSIYTFVRALETSTPKAAIGEHFSRLSSQLVQINLFWPTFCVYTYCVYPAMSESPKHKTTNVVTKYTQFKMSFQCYIFKIWMHVREQNIFVYRIWKWTLRRTHLHNTKYEKNPVSL